MELSSRYKRKKTQHRKPLEQRIVSSVEDLCPSPPNYCCSGLFTFPLSCRVFSGIRGSAIDTNGKKETGHGHERKTAWSSWHAGIELLTDRHTLLVDKFFCYSTIAPFYHIRAKERAKCATLLHCRTGQNMN